MKYLRRLLETRAPYFKFLICFAFAGFGIWAFLVLPFWWGILAFVLLVLLGSLLGAIVFKRFATPQQVKDDLEARLHQD